MKIVAALVLLLLLGVSSLQARPHSNVTSSDLCEGICEDDISSDGLKRFDSQFITVNNGIDDLFSQIYKPFDCSSLLSGASSGVYSLYPFQKSPPVRTLCDQDTDGGGWTVIQNRIFHTNPSSALSFHRNYEEYVRGFGNTSGDFWVGLQYIHKWVNYREYSLRVDLTDFNDVSSYALYNNFHISGKEDGFRLKVSGYSGTAGNGLITSNSQNHNRMKFSTYDVDKDKHPTNCASVYESGWWFSDCYQSNLNGRYMKPGTGRLHQAIQWNWPGNNHKYFKKARMSIRANL